MPLKWKLVFSSIAIITSVILSLFYLYHQRQEETENTDNDTIFFKQKREQRPQNSKSSRLPTSTNSHRSACVMSLLETNFFGLFMLNSDYGEVIEDSQTRLTNASHIQYNFGSIPFPFLNVPLVPTLTIDYEEELVKCDNIFDKRFNCLDPRMHIVNKAAKIYSERWHIPPSSRLYKKAKLNVINRVDYIKFEFHELSKRYIERALRSCLRRNSATGQLADYSGNQDTRNKNLFGYKITGEIYAKQFGRYNCGGNIYVATNVTQPFRPTRGDAFPRFAGHIHYLSKIVLDKGIILTMQDFVCRKQNPMTIELAETIVIKIDFIRSQFFPFTTLNYRSISSPIVGFLHSYMNISQLRDGINNPKYETIVSSGSYATPILGISMFTYQGKYHHNFNDSRETLRASTGIHSLFSGKAGLTHSTYCRLDSCHHHYGLFDSNEISTLYHNETATNDYISLTFKLRRDWKQSFENITTGIRLPHRMTERELSQKVVEDGGIQISQKYYGDENESDTANTLLISTMHAFLESIELTTTRSVHRSADKLRLLRDIYTFGISVAIVRNNLISIKEIRIIREEQLRHCDQLPPKANLNIDNFKCLPLERHIRDNSYGSLAGCSISSKYIKYFTVKIENAHEFGFIDIFPYTETVLNEKIETLLTAHNLTKLDFIDNHFRFGGHAAGKYSNYKYPGNKFNFIADIVWVMNRTSNVLYDVNLDNIEIFTADILKKLSSSMNIEEGIVIDRLLQSLDGHLIEVKNLQIRFENLTKQETSQRYYSNLTLITRQEFPFIYYHHDIHSRNRSTLNYSGTIKQTRDDLFINTTYNIISNANGPEVLLGAFFFNRTVCSDHKSKVLVDQMLLLYPQYNVWLKVKNVDEPTGEMRYYARFYGTEQQVLSSVNVGPTNYSKTDVSFEPLADVNFWTIKFKVKKDVYREILERIQFVDKKAFARQRLLQQARFLEVFSSLKVHYNEEIAD